MDEVVFDPDNGHRVELSVDGSVIPGRYRVTITSKREGSAKGRIEPSGSGSIKRSHFHDLNKKNKQLMMNLRNEDGNSYRITRVTPIDISGSQIEWRADKIIQV
ncbi:hypothetical protein [Halopelagius longus]|uniref:hypothetical protein n=1 Tax=Halopelagius longus TaxID=1236180 RepID=UPI0011133C8E|nr:hypothetical protein [Halopelagius longus]